MHPDEENIAEEAEPINPELDRRFTYDQMCPNSREKSLAWTALEESVFWANAAIARNE